MILKFVMAAMLLLPGCGYEVTLKDKIDDDKNDEDTTCVCDVVERAGVMQLSSSLPYIPVAALEGRVQVDPMALEAADSLRLLVYEQRYGEQERTLIANHAFEKHVGGFCTIPLEPKEEEQPNIGLCSCVERDHSLALTSVPPESISATSDGSIRATFSPLGYGHYNFSVRIETPDVRSKYVMQVLFDLDASEDLSPGDYISEEAAFRYDSHLDRIDLDAVIIPVPDEEGDTDLEEDDRDGQEGESMGE